MKKCFQIIALSVALCFTSYNAFAQKWVGTWTTAQQLVEPHNLAPEPGLSGNTIREIVQVSVGGEKIRVKFSNEHGKSPLNIKAVEIAIAQNSGSSADIKAGTSKSLKFKGKAGVTIEPGKMVSSDAIDYKLGNRENVAITIHYGECDNKIVTGHPGSRTTSYIVEGNSSDFSKA